MQKKITTKTNIKIQAERNRSKFGETLKTNIYSNSVPQDKDNMDTVGLAHGLFPDFCLTLLQKSWRCNFLFPVLERSSQIVALVKALLISYFLCLF